MILRPNLFLKEFILFGCSLVLGIFTVHNYTFLTEKIVIEPLSFSWGSSIIFLIFFFVLSLILPKFKEVNAFFLRFLLLLVVFSGSEVIFSSVVNSLWSLIFALIITVIFALLRNVLIHDICMIIGIAGVSSMLGMTISPQVVIIFLVILSFYDIIAVYWTKHMVYLAKGMMESGAIFGFVIPFEFKDFFYHSHEAKHKIGERFMILGSGDIGLPLVMVSSVALISISQAFIVAGFSLVGLFATHLIFINQSEKRPMAALPPIATLTLIGYLVAQIV